MKKRLPVIAGSRFMQIDSENIYFSISLSNPGICDGSFATGTPASLNALIFSSAVPDPLEMIAPACPILFPGGAV